MSNPKNIQLRDLKIEYEKQIESVFLVMERVRQYQAFLNAEMQKLRKENRNAKIIDEKIRLLTEEIKSKN